MDKEHVRRYVPAYSWEPHPFPPYVLTNNSAEIRRIKDRIAKIETAQAMPETSIEGANARLEDCPAEEPCAVVFRYACQHPSDGVQRNPRPFSFARTSSVGLPGKNTWSLQLATEIAQ